VPDDTAIRRTEQGQLSAGRGTIILRLRPVVRRTASAMQPDWPIPGQTLDNRSTVDENANHARSRDNRLRMVLSPVNDHELRRLESLWLGRTEITDAGLRHLKGLPALHYLNLNHTDITDAGLEHLEALTCLRCLVVGNTHVTDEGVKKLQEALPDCTISR